MATRLGIDFGKSRIGLALGSIIAKEYATIPSDDHAVDFIVDVVRSEDVDHIIVGDPVRSHGEAGTITHEINQFVQNLSEKLPDVNIILANEAYTSSQATIELERMGVSRQDAKKRIDQYAAKLILDQYNDEHPSGYL